MSIRKYESIVGILCVMVLREFIELEYFKLFVQIGVGCLMWYYVNLFGWGFDEVVQICF